MRNKEKLASQDKRIDNLSRNLNYLENVIDALKDYLSVKVVNDRITIVKGEKE